MRKFFNLLLFLTSFAIILHFMGIIDLKKMANRIKNENNSELSRDVKARKIDAFFASANAPVTGYGIEFVLASEKYNLDWRLLPAICFQESTGGKFPFNGDPENVLGYKISKDITSIREAVNLSAKSISGNGKVTYLLYKGKSTRQRLYVYSGGEHGYEDKIFLLMRRIHNDGKPVI